MEVAASSVRRSELGEPPLFPCVPVLSEYTQLTYHPRVRPLLHSTTRRGILGQLLLRVAMLFEIMTSYEDEELVREFLFANPPLRPRRTLHQSSETRYGFLKSMDRLNKEQVVYRETAPAEQSTHHHCTLLYSCRQCRGCIRKAPPRVLMVDQLWLFILDGSEYPFSESKTRLWSFLG
jgi:hypothetical protein